MGANHSVSEPNDSKRHAFLLHSEETYAGLKCDFKVKFISLFGGPSAELGQKLYQNLFEGCDPAEVDYNTFVGGMTKLHTVLSESAKESEQYFFSLYSGSKGNLEVDIQQLVHTAALCALHVGLSSEFSVPREHAALSAISAAILKFSQQHPQEQEGANFYMWLAMHLPQMLTGLRQWLFALINPSSEERLTYHLPIIECSDKDKQQGLSVTMWVLSGVLPGLYLGSLQSDRAGPQDELPSGGNWTSLYSSREHGLSMNRFQHHCFDYRQPSILIIECIDPSNKQHFSFALAMDSEWRDGTHFYGGANFHLVQLTPTYSLVKRGAKLVSLNEKQRGFPCGLRVMASQKYEYCLFEVKSSLEEVRFEEGPWMQVMLVEVWGCGGMQAKEKQLRMKEWEAKEVLRRREIHSRTSRSAWEDNPDRFLLELGGVTTKREQKTFD